MWSNASTNVHFYLVAICHLVDFWLFNIIVFIHLNLFSLIHFFFVPLTIGYIIWLVHVCVYVRSGCVNSGNVSSFLFFVLFSYPNGNFYRASMHQIFLHQSLIFFRCLTAQNGQNSAAGLKINLETEGEMCQYNGMRTTV